MLHQPRVEPVDEPRFECGVDREVSVEHDGQGNHHHINVEFSFSFESLQIKENIIVKQSQRYFFEAAFFERSHGWIN